MANGNSLPRIGLTSSVIGAFFEVYNSLGYGYLERVYSAALELELNSLGHRVGREVSVAISYKGRVLARQRLDMIVDNVIVRGDQSWSGSPSRLTSATLQLPQRDQPRNRTSTSFRAATHSETR